MAAILILVVAIPFVVWAFWRGPRWAKLIANLAISAFAGLVVFGALGYNVNPADQGAVFATITAAAVAAILTFGILWVTTRGKQKAVRSEMAVRPQHFDRSRPVDVFISYKRDERALVERIATRLKALNLSVWFDAHLSSGAAFDAEIDHHVRTAKCVLVCWSPGAVASDWVRGEATIGRQRGVLAAAVLVPCSLPAPFNLIHTSDLGIGTGPHNPEWLSLLERIGRLVDRPGLATYETA